MQYSLLLSLCTLLYTAISIAERPKIAENDFLPSVLVVTVRESVSTMVRVKYLSL